MSSSFVVKAAAGMLVLAAAPCYCVYALMNLGKSGKEESKSLQKGSFNAQFQWERTTTATDARENNLMQRVADTASPRALATKVVSWLEKRE